MRGLCADASRTFDVDDFIEHRQADILPGELHYIPFHSQTNIETSPSSHHDCFQCVFMCPPHQVGSEAKLQGSAGGATKWAIRYSSENGSYIESQRFIEPELTGCERFIGLMALVDYIEWFEGSGWRGDSHWRLFICSISESISVQRDPEMIGTITWSIRSLTSLTGFCFMDIVGGLSIHWINSGVRAPVLIMC